MSNESGTHGASMPGMPEGVTVIETGGAKPEQPKGFQPAAPEVPADAAPSVQAAYKFLNEHRAEYVRDSSNLALQKQMKEVIDTISGAPAPAWLTGQPAAQVNAVGLEAEFQTALNVPVNEAQVIRDLTIRGVDLKSAEDLSAVCRICFDPTTTRIISDAMVRIAGLEKQFNPQSQDGWLRVSDLNEAERADLSAELLRVFNGDVEKIQHMADTVETYLKSKTGTNGVSVYDTLMKYNLLDSVLAVHPKVLIATYYAAVRAGFGGSKQ